MSRAFPAVLLALALPATLGDVHAQRRQNDEHTFPTPVAGPVSPADVLRQTGHWADALASGGFAGLSPEARDAAQAALQRLRASLAPIRAWRHLRPPQVERIVADHTAVVETLGLDAGERLSCQPAASVGSRIAQMSCQLAGRQAEAASEAARRTPDATIGRNQ
ncbi:MAG: hypothetical protein KF823_09590 [Xanthomonadales bacterium]|nr:hypothetical protein [Xanthomonadales bacterium]